MNEVQLQLRRLIEAGVISRLDYQLGRTLAELESPQMAQTVLWASVCTSQWISRGHVCMELNDFSFEHFLGERHATLEREFWPSTQLWLEQLQQCSMVGPPDSYKPLILDVAGRLYLRRFHHYEEGLLEGIGARIKQPSLPIDPQRLNQLLDNHFAVRDSSPDWQRAAAVTALLRPFAIISGGPGTGKTTTVVKILAIALELDPTLRCACAAPTGKAAARLEESFRGAALQGLAPQTLAAVQELKPSTIHRLLGTQSNSPYFRHNEHNQLPFDLLVIDEASMIPLHLMAKLLTALQPHTRLILLGDKDQLASVEAGSVLGDICAAAQRWPFSRPFATALEHCCPSCAPQEQQCGGEGYTLRDSLAVLTRNYRAAEAPGIVSLALAVNAGSTDALESLTDLGDGAPQDVSWYEAGSRDAFIEALGDVIEPWYGALRKAPGPVEGFTLLRGLRILCSNRFGLHGVIAVNLLVQQLCGAGSEEWYHGRPVMILVNDYGLKLFNGDIGIALTEGESGSLRVYFESEGGYRSFVPGRLPAHETVYAMTVHKSQGSEAETVLVMLPDHDTALLTRELLYTAITRARKRVLLWGAQRIFLQGVGHRIRRASGLADKLTSAL
jgi:exodeoxyribonuclease V alpha subunit